MSKQKSWRDRSAKVQVSESELPSSIPSQTGLVFNVWYNKWSQGSSEQKRFVNPYRLDPERHSGLTRGDKEGAQFFCLYFAKGMCCLGKRCHYMHHIPEDKDIARLSMKTDILDCFGREKYGFYRDDMGGIGSFRKMNRTLYIGGLGGALNNKQLKASQIESRIRFVFSELGEIDRVRFVDAKNCAFVKFKHSANAEFAKEAMSNQTLLIPSDKEWDDRKEGTGLLCKWANDDPDPEARKREEEEQKRESVKMMVRLLDNHMSNNAELQLSETKRPIAALEDAKSNDTSIFGQDLLDKLKRRKLVKERTPTKTATMGEKAKSRSLVEYPSSDEE